MCGIIAIVRKPESRATPTSAEVLNFMEEAVRFLEKEKVETISDAKYSLDQLNEILQGTSGLYALIENEGLSKELKNHLRNLRNEIVPKVEQIIHQAEIDPEEKSLSSTYTILSFVKHTAFKFVESRLVTHSDINWKPYR